MSRAAACVALAATLYFTLTLHGTAASENQREEMLGFIAQNPWLSVAPNDRWMLAPRLHYQRMQRDPPEYDQTAHDQAITDDDPQEENSIPDNDFFRENADKRSAVATALNAGRPRRQPAPALGKAVTPYVGVGVLNDVGSFFDSLRDNLETLALLSPQQRATLFHEPPAPNVVQAPSQGGGGGGSGIRKLHALRPLRPTGNIRSYNRRSFVEPDGGYPGANHHDPGLLWTGLGRRRRR